MRISSHARSRGLGDEEGGVLVWFAVAATSIILMVAFVVDIANYFEHRRHLQLQADAGALAGGGAFAGCLAGSAADRMNTAWAGNQTINDGTRQYAGDPQVADAYNPQVGNTQQKAPPTGTDTDAGVHVLLNALQYWNHGGTDYSDTDAGSLSGAPCWRKFVDVKATESKVDSFFNTALGFLNLIPSINAHARVELRTLTTSGGGSLPIAVPDPEPKSAAVLFINEASGNAIFKTASLDPILDVNGDQVLENGMPVWATGPIGSVPIPSARVGVVVVLSGASSIDTSGTLAEVCARSLVACYDSNLSNGVDFIRGSDTASVGPLAAPRLRDVELFRVGCGDPYFVTDTATCSLGIEAKVDHNPTATNAQMFITAIGAGCPTTGNPKNCPLSVDPNQASTECTALAGTGTCWRTTTNMPAIAPQSGAQPVTMTWEQQAGTVGTNVCTNKNNNPCKGDFESGNTVQRTFSASSSRSGPLGLVELYDCDSDPTCAVVPKWKQSFPIGSGPHTFGVKIGIQGALDVTQSTALVTLRVIGGGSQNQSVDCNPTNFGDPTKPYYGYTNLWQELAAGCLPNYTVNDGSVNCAQDPWRTPTSLWAQPQPWPCVAIQTGEATNQVPKGLNERIICVPNPSIPGCNNQKPTQCPAAGELGHNNFSMYDPTDPTGKAGFPSGDPRVVEVFLTPYNSFSGSGSGTVPVTGFAVFYITGWTAQGGGFENPCQTDGTDDPLTDEHDIVGHFIKYIGGFGSSGGGGPEFCDFDDLAPCIPVLTN